MNCQGNVHVHTISRSTCELGLKLGVKLVDKLAVESDPLVVVNWIHKIQTLFHSGIFLTVFHMPNFSLQQLQFE